jgi:hypothetical protein
MFIHTGDKLFSGVIDTAEQRWQLYRRKNLSLMSMTPAITKNP